MMRKLLIVSALFLGLQMQAQFFEGFEGTFSPAGWIVSDNGTGTVQSWKLMVAPPYTPCEGNNSAIIDRENIGSGSTSEDWLISPSLTIGSNAILSFCSRTTVPGDTGTLFQVRISTTSQSDLAAFTTTWSETETQNGFDFQQKNISLAPYLGQNIYIAFVRIFTQPTTAISGDRWILDSVAVSNALGLESFDEDSFVSIFPNPGNDVIRILAKAAIQNLRIYNDLGQHIQTEVRTNNESGVELNVSNLQTGQYFIEITTESGKSSKKFFKR